MKPTDTPKCYLSHSPHGWSLILQEMPLCNHKETAAEALAVAKTFRVEPHPTHARARKLINQIKGRL